MLCLLSSGVALAQPQRPKITGIAHVALAAHDFEASRSFYHDFLGYDEVFTLPKPDGSVGTAFIKINERQYVELSPETEAGTDRLKHVAIETENAEQMRLYLKSKGISVPDKTPKGKIGNSNFMIKDPEGHSLEIVQYEPDGWTMKAKGKALPATRISRHMPHVGIIVTKLEPEKKFYEEVLGFKEIWRGSKDGKTLSWTNMQVPDGEDYLEFMLYAETPAPTARGSAHHVCLVVPSVAESVANLESRPARKNYTRPFEPKTGVNRKNQLNLFDPDGTRSELMEPFTVDGKPTPPSTAPPPGI